MKRSQPKSGELKYYGYADESITDDAIAFGSAIFPINAVADAESALAKAKQSIGLSPTATLHSKIIFHAPARRNTPWGLVQPSDIFSMVVRLCEDLKGMGERPLIFVAPASQMTFAGLGGPDEPQTHLEKKGIASIGFQSVHVHAVERYGYGGVKIWIDPDRSKIPWLGGKRRQANSTRSVYVDLGPGVEPPQLVPEIEDSPKPRLLEIADLYTYVTAQAFSGKGGKKIRWFQDLCRLIDPERLHFQAAPETEWGRV